MADGRGQVEVFARATIQGTRIPAGGISASTVIVKLGRARLKCFGLKMFRKVSSLSWSSCIDFFLYIMTVIFPWKRVLL